MNTPAPFRMARISIGLQALTASQFDVIVIGSGYGGSITASRLARLGKSVCLLERGAEILPGDYPRDLAQARAALQVVTKAGRDPHSPAGHGMMEVRLNDDMHVVLGSGLGGGSLINAGVAIEPDARVFRHGWPEALKDRAVLDPYFAQVKVMLGSTKLPDRYHPPKLKSLEQSAKAMGLKAERLDINVSFQDGLNAAGVFQAACKMCGDCCSGCNYGAKNTLLMNYLPDAHRHGATIVTQAEVDFVAAEDGQWAVHVDTTDKSIQDRKLTAKTVVLAAGALGSTEILFRSHQKAGLGLSKANLGKRFSGNGDILGFGFSANLTQDANAQAADLPMIYSIGAGANAPDQACYQPGPCITGVIKVGMTDNEPLAKALVIEDGVAPGALAAVYPPLLFIENCFDASFGDYPDMANRLGAFADLGNAVQSGTDPATLCYSGPVGRTQAYLVMSHDDSSGKLSFNAQTGLVHVDWPKVGKMAPYPRDNDILRKASQGIWANYIENPVWNEDFGNMLVTVHPVGGCPMADTADKGVVNADCQVFTGQGDAVHPGLMVCDGAVIPTSLGVNPLLTISAITERAMDRLIARNNWTAAPPDRAPAKAVPAAAVPMPAMAESVATAAPSIPFMRLILIVCLLEIAALACFLGRWAVRPLVRWVFQLGFPGQTDIAQIFRSLIDLNGGNLVGDIRPALRALSKDLIGLGWAYLFPAKDQTAHSAMFHAFLKIVKDVSPSLTFDETMRGYLSAKRQTLPDAISDPYAIAAAIGQRDGLKIVGNFHIDADSIASLDGSNPEVAPVTSAQLSGKVILTRPDGTVFAEYDRIEGTFDLLRPDIDAVETWTMTYRCTLGSDFAFTGTKYLHRKPGSGWWRDLTTLFVDLQLLPGAKQAKTNLQGIMTLGLQDFATQVGTFDMEFETKDTPKTLAHTVSTAIKAGTLHKEILSGALIHRMTAYLFAKSKSPEAPPLLKMLADIVSKYFGIGLPALFGKLILRTYGGLPAYLNDFPAQDSLSIKSLPDQDAGIVPGFENRKSKCHILPTADGSEIRLYHFPADRGGRAPVLGPIVLSPGFSTTVLSYAMLTNEQSLVQQLMAANYDVWLFDNRSSPMIKQPDHGYTIDDLVDYDWPRAIDFVLAQTKAKDVQVLGHCVGALTAQMALLKGTIKNVRQLIVSQVTVHPVGNWFNVLKADTDLSNIIVKGLPEPALTLLKSNVPDPEIQKLFEGMSTISSISTPLPVGHPGYTTNMAINMLSWNAPFFGETKCCSPTCHRIFGIYGPSYAHKNLNQATHTAIRQVFGTIATRPFDQLSLIVGAGQAVDHKGQDIYLPNYARLRLPIHILSGAENQEFLPDGGLKTLNWLRSKMPEDAHLFTRHLVDGYAHMDFFIGKDAHKDIFPHILQALKPYGHSP